MLKKIDYDHFYLDNQLVDLIAIHHSIRQANGANIHQKAQDISLLKCVAANLVEGFEQHEGSVRDCYKWLENLGYGWKYAKPQS